MSLLIRKFHKMEEDRGLRKRTNGREGGERGGVGDGDGKAMAEKKTDVEMLGQRTLPSFNPIHDVLPMFFPLRSTITTSLCSLPPLHIRPLLQPSLLHQISLFFALTSSLPRTQPRCR